MFMVNVQNDVPFSWTHNRTLFTRLIDTLRRVRINVRYCMKDVTPVFTSATFVFTTDALPDRFLSATDPVPLNSCTKNVIVDAFGAVLPGYFC
ncbi:hypothetical protein TNCV_1882041 [Trichonephila clavipes]|nr:hypothetical protein TNCV_1882041 [Trichonephila clavipes]